MWTRFASHHLRRGALSLLVGAAVFLQGAASAHASEVFAVILKEGQELIVNLGDDNSFSGLQLNPADYPADFGGNLLDAKIAVIGVFDRAAQIPLGPNQVLFPLPNFLYSGTDSGFEDPNSVVAAHSSADGNGNQDNGDSIFGESFNIALAFVDQWDTIPVGQTATIASTEPTSFTGIVGADSNFQGFLPFGTGTRIKRHRQITPIPVFGVAGGILSSNPAGFFPEFAVSFPIKITEDGLISSFTAADLPIKTQSFLVFTKNGTEWIVNAGDHDDLAANDLDLSAQIPAEFNGSLDGAECAYVGFFDKQAVRKNLFYSDPSAAPSSPSPVTEGQVGAARDNALDFFAHSLPSIAPGSGITMVAGDPGSFAAELGCDLGGALPFSVCGTAPAVGVPVAGAATNPLEHAHIQVMSKAASGLIESDGYPVPNP